MNVSLPIAAREAAAELHGRRVLVTGAGSGIGRAIAQAFARAGARVAVHHRGPGPQTGEGVLAELAGAGPRGGHVALAADLRDPRAAAGLVAGTVEALGGIDVLVNNAGAVPVYEHFTALSLDTWRETMAVNAEAPFLLTQAAWPHLEAQGFGRIVNIGTVAVRYGGSPRGVHYVAAKGALDAMTVAFAKAGAPHDILVNAIRCGVIDSGMHRKVAGYGDDDFARRAALVPLGRAGRPDEVARLALYLAGGGFMTGQLLDLAGGD